MHFGSNNMNMDDSFVLVGTLFVKERKQKFETKSLNKKICLIQICIKPKSGVVSFAVGGGGESEVQKQKHFFVLDFLKSDEMATNKAAISFL